MKPDFELTLLDCWRALEQGRSLGWIGMPKPAPAPPGLWGQIDVDEYEHYDDPMNGDLHIVVPGKFVAFKGPKDLGGKTYHDDNQGYRHFSAGYYGDIFRSLGVTAVVRLNEAQYDPADFTGRDFFLGRAAQLGGRGLAAQKAGSEPESHVPGVLSGITPKTRVTGEAPKPANVAGSRLVTPPPHTARPVRRCRFPSPSRAPATRGPR
jgi:hypothetical protein